MTGHERIPAVLIGQTPDRLSCMTITMMLAAGRLGGEHEMHSRASTRMADAQVKIAGAFGLDDASTGLGICYVAALSFLRYSLASGVCFSLLLFGLISSFRPLKRIEVVRKAHC